MSKYANGKIYKIVGGGLTYYGATIQPLHKAFHKHQMLSRNYCSSQEVIITGDAKIVLVEIFPCKSKAELTARLFFYIENNVCVNSYGNISNMNREEKTAYHDNITKQFIIFVDERSEQKRLNQFSKRHP